MSVSLRSCLQCDRAASPSCPIVRALSSERAFERWAEQVLGDEHLDKLQSDATVRYLLTVSLESLIYEEFPVDLLDVLVTLGDWYGYARIKAGHRCSGIIELDRPAREEAE